MSSNLITTLEQGFTSLQQGDLRAAERNFLAVLKRDRNNEFALNLMGVVCIRSSRAPDAIQYLQRALRVNANDPDTFNNLGLAHRSLNQFTEARAAFEQSLKRKPQQPAALNNLGNVLAATDHHEQAVRSFESALKLDPEYVDCLSNLAVSLKELGRLDYATRTIDHALRLEATRSSLHNAKGEILLQAVQYEQACDAFKKAIELDNHLVARINMSTVLKQLGDANAAVQTLLEVLNEEPNNSEAHNRLGVLYEQLGDTEAAARHFRLALEFTPNHASAFYQLSKLKDQRLTANEVDKIRALIADSQYPDIFRSSLFFALACDHEKRGEFAESIECFIAAQQKKAARHPYDESTTLEYLRLARSFFPVAANKSLVVEDDLPIPVFVVGMPRSGTTLTEQIISSHSEITAAGEIGFMNDIVRQASEFTNKPYPASIAALSPTQAQELRRRYLTRLVDRFGHGRYIADKNPLNYNFIGVIATLFPEAKVLYCKRRAMDNCISIFKLPFDDNQGYSHDLAALGHYYRQHEVLMAHWFEHYSEQILTVEYEATVNQVEQQSRAMLAFLGVEFETQVLSFYENKRIVMTPSAEQVRQPIYSSSIDSWQKYGPALKPLIDALAIEPATGEAND